MREYYYKVVRKDLSSLNVGSSRIQYARNVTIYPKIGKLFVFKKYEDAIDFTCPNKNCYKIFKCEVTNPHGIKYISVFPSYDILFWKQKKIKKAVNVPITVSPKGTYVCDSVKLIKEM